MERKSTISKAFSRFSRKTAPAKTTTDHVSTPHPANTSLEQINNQPTVDTLPSHLQTNDLNTNDNHLQHQQPLTNTAPTSPTTSLPMLETNSISPTNSDSVSQMASPVDGPKDHGHFDTTGVPLSNTAHPHEDTGLSNSSHEDTNNPEGGLNPANILLDRLNGYHAIVKNLQQYFTEVALVEQGISKAMHKASNMVVVPFKDGHQFLGKGGLQDVCAGVRESSQMRSEQHVAASRFVEETVVKNIRRLKQDIKNKIKGLKSDSNLYATRVFKEREATQEKIGSLAKAIGFFENSGGHQHDMERPQSDPYVINLSLRRQLARQVHEENLFARALQQCQEQIMLFEKHVINELKQIMRTFAQYQTGSSSVGFGQSWAPTEAALNALQEDTEWNDFFERNGHLLFPSDLVDSDPDQLDYPCRNSPYVSPLKTGHLSRQSSVLKNWKDGYFVLTLAGWLHVFASSDPVNDPIPERSIYIPTAILGPHTDHSHRQHVFSLEGKGMGGILHRDAQVFTVRANSREDMLDWWSEISKHAQSTTFTHAGDGQLDGNLSRSGSLLRSSTVKRSGSQSVRPNTSAPPVQPQYQQQQQQQPYLEQQQHSLQHQEPSLNSQPQQQVPPYVSQAGYEHPPPEKSAVDTTLPVHQPINSAVPSNVPATTTETAAPVGSHPMTSTAAIQQQHQVYDGTAPAPTTADHQPILNTQAPTDYQVAGTQKPVLPEITTQPLSMERHDTGSTVSLNTTEMGPSAHTHVIQT